MDVFSDDDMLVSIEKELSLWSEKRLDPWTRKRIKLLNGVDSYCPVLMTYAQFPTEQDLSPHYIFTDTVTVEGNVQIFHALETDFDERRKEAEAQEKSLREAFLNSADSSAQLILLNHLKGEMSEPQVAAWGYIFPNQRMTLYDPKGYIDSRELGSYGIRPDGSVAAWEDSMAEKPILIPNFSALNRFIHTYQDRFLLDMMFLGIDKKDRVYASGNRGIYVMDRDMTHCSFVKCSKMIDNWYLNDAGEFCFFGRNQDTDTYFYKIIIDETQWEDCREVG